MSIATGSHPTPGDVLRGIWAWLSTHDKTRWVLLFSLLCTVCYLLNTDPVFAAPEDESNANTLFLPLGGVTDTHGVPIWRYTELPMDPGNAVGYVMRAIRYFVASIFWAFYMLPVLLVIGLVDWVLKFEWLTWLASPFVTVSEGLTGFLDTWMLIPLGLLVSALVIGVGYVRGRTGAATVEFFMVVLVFGLLASPMANPLTWLTGDGGNVAGNSGLIRQVADTGAEAGSMTINQEATPGESSVAGSIIDLTLRNPMMTMSFGSPLSGECEATWNDAATNAENSADDIRKEVIKCSEDVAKANQTDSFVWLLHYLMAWPGMIGVMFLIAVFLGFMLWQVVQVFIGSVVVVVRGFLAVFPGRSRQAWLNSLFQVIISAVMVGVFIWALTVYMWVMNQMVAVVPPNVTQIGSILIGLLVLFMAFTFWKMKKAGKNLGERIAKALGKNGLSKDSPERQPSKFGSTVGNLTKSAVSKGININQNRKFLAAARVAQAAATVGTGGVGGVAAKAGTGMVVKAVTRTAARKAISASAGKGQLAIGRGPGSSPSAPGSSPELSPSSPSSVPLPVLSSLPLGSATAPMSAENSHSPSPSRHGRALNGASPSTHQTGMNAVSGTVVDPQPGSMDSHRVNRIPAGNYGGTWVHKNGHTHRPVTVTREGEQAHTVPTEEKINRSFHDGNAWVISPGVKPSAHAAAPARPSEGTPSPRRSSPNPQTKHSAPANYSSAPAKSPAPAARPAAPAPAARPAARPVTAPAPAPRPAPRPDKSAGEAQPPTQSSGKPRPTPRPMKPRANEAQPRRGDSE